MMTLFRTSTLVLLLAAAACAGALPASFVVELATDVPLGDGAILINVTTALAPNGAQRVWDLVHDGFFDDSAFTRLVPNFVVQFGIAGDPAENTKWRGQTIPDDPVATSNTRGTVTFAATSAPNSRTTQLFINYADNAGLDKQRFAPFGQVIRGMDVALAVYNPTPGNTAGVNQGDYARKGNAWLREKYPKANFITKATIKEMA